MATLKHHIATLILTLLVIASFGQKNKPNYLLVFSDNSLGQELRGFKIKSGGIAINQSMKSLKQTLYMILLL